MENGTLANVMFGVNIIYASAQKGDSLLVGDGGQTHFGFVKRCLVYLWVISISLGLLIRKIDMVNAKYSFSPNYCSTDTKKTIKLLFFIYHEAINISLGSKNVANLVIFLGFSNICCV